VPVLVIDDTRLNVDRAQAQGIPAIRGSAASDPVLAKAIRKGRRSRCWRSHSRWRQAKRWPNCACSTPI